MTLTYEWRWRWDGFTSPHRHFKQPQWRGEDLQGRIILIHAEQGFGDTIQFIRYIPLVAAKCGQVILEVHPELSSLMASLRDSCELVIRGQPLPLFDYHCPLMSLPLAFGTTLTTIPADTPYLRPQPFNCPWISSITKGLPKVGLVWAGSLSNTNDRKRSLPASLISPLLKLPAMFYSFQKLCSSLAGEDEGLTFAGRLPGGSDFVETAAAIMQMDLIISVDTAVAHLAGALGKPVWILLPKVSDWRWLTERRDSPWYPSARLFRQPKTGDWLSVIDEVADELGKFASNHSDLARLPLESADAKILPDQRS